MPWIAEWNELWNWNFSLRFKNFQFLLTEVFDEIANFYKFDLENLN